MAKTLGLDIVIGASIGTALKSVELVTNSTKVLGSSIEKLNNKKISILDGIDKDFKSKLEPIENKLQSFYQKQKELKLKIKVKDNELKEFQTKLKATDKELKTLENEKLNLEKDFKKGKISANEFEIKTKQIESEITKLQNKKIGLDNKLQIASQKSTALKNSLKSVNKTVDNLKDKKIKLANELEKAKEKAIETNKEIKKLGSAIKSLENRKIKIQANIDKRNEFKSKALDTMALGASIAAPFKAGIEFESEMARVKALSGATGEEFKKLQDTAKKLGSTTTFSASEAAKGMQFLAMAGFKTNQITQAMPGLLNLAAAGQTDLAETADITSNILSGFGISADKTGHVADVLAKAMTTANVDTRMLGETMKYVGPAAASLGASLEETTTLTAKLGDVGIQASAAGTALRSMYLRMASPPSEAKKTIAKLGLTTKDANGNFVGMINLIQQLQEKTKGLSNTQIAGYMKSLFGTEAVSGAVALLKVPAKELRKYENSLKHADGTAKKIAKTQTDTVAGSFKALGSAIEGLSISFSSLFLPAIKSATNAITFIAQKVNSFVTEHKTLASIIGGVVAGFGALTVAGFMLGYVSTFVANAYHKTRIAFTLVKNATLLLSTAEGRAAIQTKLLAFWSGILNTKAKLVTVAKTAWAFATSALSKSVGFLGSVLRFAGQGALWLGRTLMSNPIGLAIAVIAGGAYLIYSNWDKLKGYFSSLWNGIKSIFTESLDIVKGIISFSPFGIIINNWNVIKNYFSNFWDWIANKFNIGVDFISNIFSSPITIISNVWSKLSNWFSGFWGNIKSGFKSGASSITNIFLHPINTIQSLWNKLLGWISKKIEWISSMGAKIKSFFGFGDNKEKKLTLKPVVEKVKPIVTTATLATTLATTPATTATSSILKPVEAKSITATTSTPVNTQKQSAGNTQTIVYNFNFGDIKLETKDGKIANPQHLKIEIEKVIEEINFEKKQRSLSDVV